VPALACSAVSVGPAYSCALLFRPFAPRIGFKTGTGLGVERSAWPSADFKPTTNDPQNAALLKTFNDTLWNDLDNSGVVELVSKSFYRCRFPASPRT